MYVGFLSVLLLGGYRELERELSAQVRDQRTSQETLGRALAPAVARTWRVEGEVAADYLVNYFRRLNDEVDTRLVHLSRTARAAHRPRVAPERIGLREGRALRTVVLDSAQGRGQAGARRLVSYVLVPLSMPGEDPVALELTSTVPRGGQMWQRALRRVATPLVIGAAVSGGITLLAGTVLVWWPLRKVVQHARRVGEEDFSARLAIRQRDEIGTLARAMNRMSDRLQASRDRLTAEEAAHRRAQDHLWHAERLATVGRLASGIAHELGTPLHVAAGRARMIGEDPGAGPAARENAAIIVRQVDRMGAVIRQLLDFARSGPGRPARTDLASLVRETIELLGPLAEKRGVRLAADLRGDGFEIEVDRAQIQQALVNLVVNAVHASHESTVTVELSWQDAARPGAPPHEAPRPHLCMAVEDRGTGIPGELLRRVFEPFVTTKEVGQGTGLGLAVVHGIAQRHGGWVDATSRPGEGSRFSVYVPRDRAGAPTEAP